MSKEKIFIFDTTLRDGAQTEGVNFSIDDKNKIAKALSSLGVDYLEGGWPGANTLDTTFFNKPPKLENTILTAFGMTKKVGRSAENDPGLSALLNTKAPAICLVGKTWDFHVDVALGITKEEHFIRMHEVLEKNAEQFRKVHIDCGLLLNALSKDKKNTSNLINLILLKKIGKIRLNLNFKDRKIYDFLKNQLMN